MTKLETIQMIGDAITKIDVERGSLLPDDAQRHQLDDERILLDDKQKRLSRAAFDENSKAFQDGTAELKNLNVKLQQTLDGLENLQKKLQLIQSFTKSVTTLLSAVAPFA